MGRRKKGFKNSFQFTDSLLLTNDTFVDYLNRFKKLALSIFEWVNLPSSMNARFLEETLYYEGQATLLKTKDYGYINSRCTSNGKINIYNLPSAFNCWSYDSLNENRSLYTGFTGSNDEFDECILVQNDWDRMPTAGSMELFAYRLTIAETSCDSNINLQKFPLIIAGDEKQRLFLENLMNQFLGNQPIIIGDKKQLNGENLLKAIKTDVPFVADKLMDYKKEIWNEALTFLGINNILVDKKERLITDEANSNNELINLNLQSFLAPRQEACKQFNEKFGLTGSGKEISVRVRSDLHNIIKTLQSTVTELNPNTNIDIDIKKEGAENE